MEIPTALDLPQVPASDVTHSSDTAEAAGPPEDARPGITPGPGCR